MEFNERENTCVLGYTADGKIIKSRKSTDSTLLLSQIFHSVGFHDDEMNKKDKIEEILKCLIIIEGTTFASKGNDDIKTMEIDMILEEKT